MMAETSASMVAEPVEIRQRLQIGFVLDKFFSAATEQADVGIDALDHLAVKLQNQAQHPVCRRVLRSEIDREIAARSLGHADFLRFAGTETPGYLHLFRKRADRRNV
jgi:hypothetical protein